MNLRTVSAIARPIDLSYSTNRTTGLPATVPDLSVVLALRVWLSSREHWVFGLLTAGVFLLDRFLERPLKHQTVFAAMAAGAALLSLLTTGEPSIDVGRVWVGGAVVFLFCLLFVPVILNARDLSSVGDETKEPMSVQRVRTGQVIALTSGVTAALLVGSAGVIVLLPLWAAIVGASAWQPISLVRKSPR